MGTQGFYRGTSHDQVPFFVNKEQKMIEALRWPSEYALSVDMSKVNTEVMCKWINQRITELLGFEDDIIVDYCKEQLFQENENFCPKKLQINLTGFLSKNASRFVRELWSLLLAAQTSPNGIPPKLLEQNKMEAETRRQEAKQLNDAIVTSLQVSQAAKAPIPSTIRVSSLNRLDTDVESDSASNHKSQDSPRHRRKSFKKESVQSNSSLYSTNSRLHRKRPLKILDRRSRKSSHYSRESRYMNMSPANSYRCNRYNSPSHNRQLSSKYLSNSRLKYDVDSRNKFERSDRSAYRFRSTSRRRHIRRDRSSSYNRRKIKKNRSESKLKENVKSRPKHNQYTKDINNTSAPISNKSPHSSRISIKTENTENCSNKALISPREMVEKSNVEQKPVTKNNAVKSDMSEPNKADSNLSGSSKEDPYAGRCYMDKVEDKKLLRTLNMPDVKENRRSKK